MPYTPITDHAVQTQARMISQYQGLPRWAALWRSYSVQGQELEDVFWDIFLAFLIDSAVQSRLEALGRIVGQPRRGAADNEYRVYVKARIAVNRSHGRIPDLLRLLTVLYPDSQRTITPYFPRAIVAEVLGIDTSETDPEIAHEMFCEAVEGTTACSLEFSEEEEDALLTWSDDDEFQDDEARGFGGDDPDAGTGGLFTGVY
jgi:hypothetical protein